MVTTPRSENLPLQGIQFPRGWSSGVENGLNNLGWETWVYELGPLRDQAHSFHSSGWGWNIEPPAWDRRSLLTGSSRGGPSRRENRFGNHTLPGHRGAIRSSGTRSRRTLSSTPGSRAIGGKCVKMKPRPHLCHRIQSERSWMREGEPEWAVRRLSRCKQIHLCLADSFHISSTTSGWSLQSPGLSPCLDRMSAPMLWAPGCKLLAETTTSFRTTGGFGTPVCKVDVTSNLPGDLCRRSPMCCLSGQAHGGPWDLSGNSWEQEIQPTSPGGWCAMRDDGPSTDLDSSVPPRSLPSPWGRHLSLASCDDMKLPTWDPGTGTKVSFTLPSHEGIAAWPWSCKRGCPSGKTLWSWVTTAGVSCATVQRYHLGCCCHKT